MCWGPRVVVSTFHARLRGSVPGLGGFKETKMFLPHPRVKVSIVGSLCDREVACSASDRQGSNFESCVWRTVSSHSSHHPQEVLLAQFSRFISFLGHVARPFLSNSDNRVYVQRGYDLLEFIKDDNLITGKKYKCKYVFFYVCIRLYNLCNSSCDIDIDMAF